MREAARMATGSGNVSVTVTVPSSLIRRSRSALLRDALNFLFRRHHSSSIIPRTPSSVMWMVLPPSCSTSEPEYLPKIDPIARLELILDEDAACRAMPWAGR